MPLLALFAKSKKQRNLLNTQDDASSSLSHSPTAEYVIPSKFDTPSTPNGNPLMLSSNDASLYTSPPASSSKLLLPFRRKRTEGSDSSLSPTTVSTTPQLSSPYASRASITSISTNTERRPNRNPPPSKSAIFAAYSATNGALSTRSLPNDVAPMQQYSSFSSAISDPPRATVPPEPIKSATVTSRRRGLFHWPKSARKSQTNLLEDMESPPKKSFTHTPGDTSFNLKAFRHIRAPSPPLPDSPPVMPAARSRGGSDASDASQRISVAAFREAKRGNTADSPAASIKERDSRNPSRVDVSTPNLLVPTQTARPRTNNTVLQPGQGLRRSTATGSSTPRLSVGTISTFRGSGSAYDVETSDEEEEEEDSDDDVPDGNYKGKGKAPEKTKPKAQSEMGHGYATRSTPAPMPSLPGTRALSAYSSDTGSPTVQTLPRSQSNLSAYSMRPRASLSTSALVPSDDAKRASWTSGKNDEGVPKAKSSHSHSYSDSRRPLSVTSSSTSSDDEDDAPLATLVTPKRPGSDMSHASSKTKLRKPLIDINALTSPPSSSATVDGRPVKFLSPVNSLKVTTDRNQVSAKRTVKPPGKEGSGDSAVSGHSLGERLARVVHSVGKKEGETVPPTAALRPKHHRRTSSEGSHRISVGDIDASWLPKNNEKEQADDRIIPTPIKQRVPPSSFSVTSRPQYPASATTSDPSNPPRQRSVTLLQTSTSSPSLNASQPPLPSPGREATSNKNASVGTARPRSTTLTSLGVPSQNGLLPVFPTPTKPFANGRRESPASSTGDSSSGRVPSTPRDGSDLNSGKAVGANKEDAGINGLGVGRGKGRGKHGQRPSVSFEDEVEWRIEGRENERGHSDGETRRRERRRTEAKAAIELGNVINGPGPIVDDDEDGPTMGNRTSMVNPMMGMVNPMQMGFGAPGPWPGAGWPPQQGANRSMLSPMQSMVPPPADPSFFEAHRQAMMYAKQAYQMAVAQQALAAAGEEWERGSNVGFGGGSVYGGPSTAGAGFGMYPMNMGMGMGMGGWGAGGMFPGGQRPMYGGFSGAQSEYGGGTGPNMNWNSSQSVYGGAFGPSNDRGSGGRGSGNTAPPLPTGRNAGVNGKGRGTRVRTSSGPAIPSGVGNSSARPSQGKLGATPPSSWRAAPGI